MVIEKSAENVCRLHVRFVNFCLCCLLLMQDYHERLTVWAPVDARSHYRGYDVTALKKTIDVKQRLLRVVIFVCFSYRKLLWIPRSGKQFQRLHILSVSLMLFQRFACCRDLLARESPIRLLPWSRAFWHWYGHCCICYFWHFKLCLNKNGDWCVCKTRNVTFDASSKLRRYVVNNTQVRSPLTESNCK